MLSVTCPDYSTGARLAQPVERKALNLVVVGLSPTVGEAAAVRAVRWRKLRASSNPRCRSSAGHAPFLLWFAFCSFTGAKCSPAGAYLGQLT